MPNDNSIKLPNSAPPSGTFCDVSNVGRKLHAQIDAGNASWTVLKDLADNLIRYGDDNRAYVNRLEAENKTLREFAAKVSDEKMLPQEHFVPVHGAHAADLSDVIYRVRNGGMREDWRDDVLMRLERRL